MKYDYLLIDGNNLFWRSFIENTIEIQDYLIYFKTIQKFLDRVHFLKTQYGYNDSKIYFLFDNPENKINIRKYITDGKYKHIREKRNIPKHLYHTLDILIELLKKYSNDFYILKSEGLEADDLTQPVLKKILTDNKNALCISADMDWSRNITTNCHWYNFYILYNIESFFKKYQFNPKGNAVQIYKAFKGDSSDCIPNAVPRLPLSILMNIIENCKDITSSKCIFKKILNLDIDSKWKTKIFNNKKQILINYQLADFLLFDIKKYNNFNLEFFRAKENIKILRLWFKILNLPFEERMKSSLEKKTDLFAIRRLKRI